MLLAKSSTIFEASFANAEVVARITADQEANRNILPPAVREQITQGMLSLSIKNLPLPHTWKAVSGTAYITSVEIVPLDLCFKILHTSSLLLRNVTWKIPSENIDVVILRTRVLESIGFEIQRVLQSACDENEGDIDVFKKQQDDEKTEIRDGELATFLASPFLQ